MGKQRTKQKNQEAAARAREREAGPVRPGGGGSRPRRPEPFELAPEKEAAFWALAAALGLDPRLGVYPLVNRVLGNGGGLRGHAAGHLAARDLKEALGRGLPVQFKQRPSLQTPRV